MAGLNLATSSARTHTRSVTAVPASLACSWTAARFSPLTDSLCPPRPGRRTAAMRRARQSRSAGMPAAPADRGPGAVPPGADGGFAPDCGQVTGQQNLSLPVPLAGLALAHRPAQARPGRLAAAKAAGRVLRFSWQLQRRRAGRRPSRHVPSPEANDCSPKRAGMRAPPHAQAAPAGPHRSTTPEAWYPSNPDIGPPRESWRL
jgi:hypothetical protein